MRQNKKIDKIPKNKIDFHQNSEGPYGQVYLSKFFFRVNLRIVSSAKRCYDSKLSITFPLIELHLPQNTAEVLLMVKVRRLVLTNRARITNAETFVQAVSNTVILVTHMTK